MGTLREIVFDCDRPSSLARFWVEVLDGFEVRPYEHAEIARLADLGFTPETDPTVMVDGPGLKLCFQKTSPTSTPKNKLHVDVVTSNRADDVDRLTSLGASVVETFESHTWLRDPEGNDFCLTDPR